MFWYEKSPKLLDVAQLYLQSESESSLSDLFCSYSHQLYM